MRHCKYPASIVAAIILVGCSGGGNPTSLIGLKSDASVSGMMINTVHDPYNISTRTISANWVYASQTLEISGYGTPFIDGIANIGSSIGTSGYQYVVPFNINEFSEGSNTFRLEGIAGVLATDVPTTGSASYAGSASLYAQDIFVYGYTDESGYHTVAEAAEFQTPGDAMIEADFGAGTVTVSMNGFSETVIVELGGSSESVSNPLAGAMLTLSNMSITDSRFAAPTSFSLTRNGQNVGRFLGSSGDTAQGVFYGPGAAEVAGRFYTSDGLSSLTGLFVGKQ